MQLVEIKPLTPLVGAYRCPIEQADSVTDVLETGEDGFARKRQIGLKRYRGTISFDRQSTDIERADLIAGKTIPGIVAIDPDNRFVSVIPAEPTVRVPADIASNLIARGLAIAA